MSRTAPYRWVAIGGATLLLLAAIASVSLYRTYFGRAILGLSTIIIANQGDRPLRDVQVDMTAVGRGPMSRSIESVPPGESRTIRVRTSELYLDGVTFTIDNETHTVGIAGIACRGEQLVVSINGAEDVSTDYAR